MSDDDGASWRRLDFSGEAIVSVALAPDGALFVATAEVVLWRFANDRWQRWLVRSGASDVVPIAAEDGVFVGLHGRVWRPSRMAEEVHGTERRPIWHSTVLGDGSLRITALAASGRTVVAGTSGGTFISRDAGEQFAAFSEGLTAPAVVSLAYPDSETLYALGLGGTVWRRSAG
jgi:photosystem II stability/assembly factor-like uncharacterized protein